MDMLIWLSLRLQKIRKYTGALLYIYTYISNIIFIIIQDISRASQALSVHLQLLPL